MVQNLHWFFFFFSSLINISTEIPSDAFLKIWEVELLQKKKETEATLDLESLLQPFASLFPEGYFFSFFPTEDFQLAFFFRWDFCFYANPYNVLCLVLEVSDKL